MSKTKCDIRIGTSGWHYVHWLGRFYPENLPKSGWFEYYAKDFDTVEINNTFYHLPKEQTLENWYEQAPAGFIYAVKANRYITHIKRLKDSAEPIERFFERVNILREKLGPILFQLPPGLHKDLERLKSFIEILPGGVRAVFEFRHESWFLKDTFDTLRDCGAGFCIHDMPGMEVPREVTSDIIYIRFHGTSGRYQGNYPQSTLKDWAQWIGRGMKNIRGVYAYFNNDFNAYAVNNAKQLRKLLVSR